VEKAIYEQSPDATVFHSTPPLRPNTPECGLHVTSVAFRRKRRHWKLINNPFPATLQPGSCMNLVVRYIAAEKCPRSCELEIKSDDPNMPVKIMELWTCSPTRSGMSAVRRSAAISATRIHVAVSRVRTPVARKTEMTTKTRAERRPKQTSMSRPRS